LRLLDEEALKYDLANVPEDERHWTARPSSCLFSVVPNVTVSVNPSGAIAIDSDVVTRYDKTGLVILEEDGVCILTPVV